jgi:hypothetical protein
MGREGRGDEKVVQKGFRLFGLFGEGLAEGEN